MPSTVPDAENTAKHKTKIPEPMGSSQWGDPEQKVEYIVQFWVTLSIVKNNEAGKQIGVDGVDCFRQVLREGLSE